MDSNRFAEDFLISHKSYLPSERVALLKSKLSDIEQTQQSSIHSIPLKNPLITLILSLTLGWLGIDRFYIGDILLGIFKVSIFIFGVVTAVLLFGFFFLFGYLLWVMLDIYLCYKKTKELNFQNIMMYL